jgi:hypothetical protein
VSESRTLTREGELKVFLGFAAQPLAAALITFVLFPVDNLTYGVPGAPRAIILGAVVGAGSASVFWWIAGRHLPGER